MGLVSSFLNMIKAAFKKIINAIIDFIKKFWVLILVVAIVWFAPQIALLLLELGAPQWLITGIGYVALATPYLVQYGTLLYTGVLEFGGWAWSAYKNADLAMQFALAAGSFALLAPDETQAFVSDTVETVVDVVGTVAGGVAGGIASGISNSPLGTALLVGGCVWLGWMLLSSGDGSGESTPVQHDPLAKGMDKPKRLRNINDINDLDGTYAYG